VERFDTVTVGFITPSVQIAFDVFELVSVIVFILVEVFLVCYSSFERLSVFYFFSKFFLVLMSFGNHPNHASPDYPNPLKDDCTDCDPVASC